MGVTLQPATILFGPPAPERDNPEEQFVTQIMGQGGRRGSERGICMAVHGQDECMMHGRTGSILFRVEA